MKRYETNIDALMDEKGIKNDKELSELLKMPQSTLSARMNGNLSMDTLEKLGKALGVPVYDLLKKEIA